ncbi:MAG: calcium/sodium antiporter [Paracoccaceae bacterium]|nr:calcium/sodium antiporter [Paracoccaceae bacterium]
MEWLQLAIGFGVLLFAGDLLVRGAVHTSLRLGVPAFIVSLTIVAIGTSAPEMLISVSAVLDGAPGLAVGNVVGSNIANVLLVLGLPALFSVLKTSETDTRFSYYQLLFATALFTIFALSGSIDLISGVVLLLAFGIGIALSVNQAMVARNVRRAGEMEETVPGEELHMPWWRILVLLLVGLAGLPFGADLLVDSASTIARTFNVSETVIGLTVVAVGTSLPELATSVAAALRKQADVALGNVIGSCIANILAIIGVAGLFGSVPIGQDILGFDLWVMVGTTVLLAPFVFRPIDIDRIWGILFVGAYVVYVSVVLF